MGEGDFSLNNFLEWISEIVNSIDARPERLYVLLFIIVETRFIASEK